MTSDASRPHRPVPLADLTALLGAATGTNAYDRAEVAAATAAAVLTAGREALPLSASTDRFVGLADLVGLDTLAELWRDSDPISLPGALWALYLLRRWCHSHGHEVAALWRAGQGFAPADAVVAGVEASEDPAAIRDLADSVLLGVYRGELDVALDRAASFFRVVASGRRESSGVDAHDLELAQRNERAAADLSAAARLFRSGSLH